MKCFRCGYCGQPCTDDGQVLELWQIAVMNPFVDWDHAEQVQGDCCQHEAQGGRLVEVTREMALDACCPEMEGSLIEWS